MYLKNLANGYIQELHNPDVIKTLMGDKRYLLADTREALTGEEPAGAPVIEEVQEEEDELADIMPRPTEPTEPTEQETQEVTAGPDYKSMTLKQLRDAAKKAGITGYSNMDKTTLAAVLEMH